MKIELGGGFSILFQFEARSLGFVGFGVWGIEIRIRCLVSRFSRTRWFKVLPDAVVRETLSTTSEGMLSVSKGFLTVSKGFLRSDILQELHVLKWQQRCRP